MLHTLTRSPQGGVDFTALAALVRPGDALVLLQDGVLCALTGSAGLTALSALPVALHVLREDVLARGLTAYVAPACQLIGYSEFVALSEAHPRQMAW
ncbi:MULTISPECIES: sulfurtransferase complex subunit TusB [Edwardsiella]|uniref:tRNA 5-methylaminomethyl-2-thiouridine synthase TusB n=2 Tax=Edwardsiella anguillarum TaxID=1821960 RepID=A0A076LHC3_9GAMM|nr:MULTISPECIES: sulfurtransferase complex subunit TusB [Edwardsiella]AKM46666.1 sulfur transfer complex subunit TusB [Edwardsiella sp. EA181011]GAJ67689.1 tRNA 5-methylaminomethyl-2-thiouridine synthase TusB [Edwardsiella piscicida]AIJ07915.1 tRNA 5-methylaminomethyl-2-thiouridine synthase TusB [Edwardsiella anguillarum ET080813]AKR79013.1 sulfurtransferase complex subunit TusB [Edwardsiella sp. LADL05-105]KAB0591765.1 sulfurtransferase complex subunit TusB [Edwardsiella anguillarum]